MSSPHPSRPPVAAIVGPTAAGKTAIAVDVAETLGAEIISIDSMQIYRGMDIGTDKPPEELRRRVPHHLIDVFDADRNVSVAEFQALARAAIDDVSGRGRIPLLVGGSGLYFRAVVDELSFPPTSEEVRAGLEQEVGAQGPEALHRRLSEIDPEAAAKIEPGNVRRVVRALEAIALTGAKFSAGSGEWERFESRYRLAVAGLTRPRPDLFDRIARRVDAMLAAGLAGEAKRLARTGMSRSARQALGYRQVLEMSDASAENVRDEIVRATKRFARRQESWFKSDPRVQWFDASRPETAAEVARFARAALRLDESAG